MTADRFLLPVKRLTHVPLLLRAADGVLTSAVGIIAGDDRDFLFGKFRSKFGKAEKRTAAHSLYTACIIFDFLKQKCMV